MASGAAVTVTTNSGTNELHGVYSPSEATIKRRCGPVALVTMCANCRRTRKASVEAWVRVPQYFAHAPPEATHGLCPPCIALYFPGGL